MFNRQVSGHKQGIYFGWQVHTVNITNKIKCRNCTKNVLQKAWRVTALVTHVNTRTFFSFNRNGCKTNICKNILIDLTWYDSPTRFHNMQWGVGFWHGLQSNKSWICHLLHNVTVFITVCTGSTITTIILVDLTPWWWKSVCISIPTRRQQHKHH